MVILSVNNLRFEYRRNPIGIDIPTSRFNWQLESLERGCLQQAYQLQTSLDAAFSELFWDSGIVVSDQTVHVPYGGQALMLRTRYYWRVQAWDTKDNASGWSETAFFETGLLSSKNWQADWIASPVWEDRERCPMLRKELVLNKGIRSARVYASALGLYSLYINGRRAAEDLFAPGWTNYNKWIQYQTYDVTSLLTEGTNCLGALLGNGWFRGNIGFESRREIYGKDLALILQLHVTYQDGTDEVIRSDDTWQAAPSPILMSEIYHGETYDARLEVKGWNHPGTSAEGWLPVNVLDHPKTVLQAQVGASVKAVEEIRPAQLFITPAGDTVLDFGQNLVGWIRFSVQGTAGDIVEIHHAEVLDKDGNFYTENLRSAKQILRYHVKGDDTETYQPYFTFQGFRYAALKAYPGTPKLSDFTAVVIHSDMEITGRFFCSEPLVNQLQHNILWGQKGNFLDVPTDCPQRDERLGWTGDAQVFIRTACFNMNVAPFFTKWLYDLKSEQLENGGVPYVIPNVLGGDAHSSAAWGDAAVICPWTLYLCYGDKHFLEDQYDSMKAWIGYMRSQGETETLWNTGFHFGDWLALDAKEGSYIGTTARDFIATAFFAYSTRLVKETALLIGKGEDAQYYQDLYDRILNSFRREFVTPSGRLAVPTQTAYVLALMFDLVDEKDRERVLQDLTADLLESDVRLKTGFVGTPYLCEVLTRHGRLDLAYQLLLKKDYPSWLYQIEKGATTIWEHWDGIKPDGTFWSKDMNSFNHYAYGSIGDWLYRIAAGLDTDPSQPGYKHSRIHPHPLPESGIDHARAALHTLYGLLVSEWTLQDGSMNLTVTIPPNTTSELILPKGQREQVQADSKELKTGDGIQSITQSGDDIQITLLSGTYQFRYPFHG